ncbi:sodium channel regulatory subunit beta-2 isoform X2 [Carettochelys insculpta]|uniref:sodium channel regulatory subunit beta-2 isoform X2 n=1 Tax=Carettochelys insculpta TaxID=44489 RepID=UPI003EBD5DC7
MSKEPGLPWPTLCLAGLSLLVSLAPCGLGMEIMAQSTISALNGTSVRLSCTFTSCYKVDYKLFSLNWTYQNCDNCTEDLLLQFRAKVVLGRLERFENRVEFTGNPNKNDLSFTLHDVQLDDEGFYNCFVKNPPDRHLGHARIFLKVITEGGWTAGLCRGLAHTERWRSAPGA